MITPIFAKIFTDVMEKMYESNPTLNFGYGQGKNIYKDLLMHADRCVAQIDEIDENTYVMLICSLIAQKHMCGFDTWSSPKVYRNTLTSRFLNERMLAYFEKIDEAFECMGYAFSSQRKEYIIEFYEEFDFFQNIEDYEQMGNYINSIAEAIAICPQYEYAYCFLVVEYCSLVMGTSFNVGNKSEIAEYYYRAYSVMDEELFRYVFSGEMKISYWPRSIVDKYKGIRNENDLSEAQRKEYLADINLCKTVNSYAEHLQDKQIADGCISVGDRKYKIGLPFVFFIAREEKEKYLATYFEEIETHENEARDTLVSYYACRRDGVVYRDEKKTLITKSFQNHRGFSYYMPKVEGAPLRAFPKLSSLVVQTLTRTIMERSHSELELQQKYLSLQNQLDRIRKKYEAKDDIEAILADMMEYYDLHRVEIDESQKGLVERKLKMELGKDVWGKISDDVKAMLVSAEISYDALRNIYGVDYSPAIIPLTKAVENILNVHIYQKGIYAYLKGKDLHEYKQYKRLYHYDRSKDMYLPNASITMGQAEYMFDKYDTFADGMIQRILACEKDRERTGIVTQIKEILKEITEYRNQVAHMDGVDEDVMRLSRDRILYAQISLIKNFYKLM